MMSVTKFRGSVASLGFAVTLEKLIRIAVWLDLGLKLWNCRESRFACQKEVRSGNLEQRIGVGFSVPDFCW
jgi:hypothetical protein